MKTLRTRPWFSKSHCSPTSDDASESKAIIDDDDHAESEPAPRRRRRPPSIGFRPIGEGDREVIQQLHEEWFPVTYQDEFYDDLVAQRGGNYGESLYTCLATIGSDDEEAGGEEIIGCVVGSFIHRTKLTPPLQALLISDGKRYRRLFYIMTLGTVDRYRHAGLGTELVQKCVEQVQQDPSCGVLYLHVITFNQAAIRLYEKMGFYRVEEIVNYYLIDGRSHNCYVYAKYFHGRYSCVIEEKSRERLTLLCRQSRAPRPLGGGQGDACFLVEATRGLAIDAARQSDGSTSTTATGKNIVERFEWIGGYREKHVVSLVNFTATTSDATVLTRVLL